MFKRIPLFISFFINIMLANNFIEHIRFNRLAFYKTILCTDFPPANIHMLYLCKRRIYVRKRN